MNHDIANDTFSEACSTETFTRQLLGNLRQCAEHGIGMQLDSDGCRTLLTYISKLQEAAPKVDNVVSLPIREGD